MSRALVLAMVVTVASGFALAPTQPIVAAAPFEVWADGFGSLRGIAIDGDDAVHVADREAGTITRLDQQAGRTVVAQHLDRPVGLAFDTEGRLLVAEGGGARVVRLEAGIRTPVAQGIGQPRWLAVAEDGTLYVSARRVRRDADSDTAEESAEAHVILSLPPGGQLSVFADGFAGLQGLAVHGAALHAAARGRRGEPGRGVVYRLPIAPDGGAGAPDVVMAGLVRRPVGLVADRLGGLYVSAAVATLDGERERHAIAKVHRDGTVTSFATGLAEPRGLAFDSRGHLYVADGTRVLRFLAPPAPEVAAPPAYTNQAALGVTGLTLPGARVDVLLDGGLAAATTLATPDGAFAATVALAPNVEARMALLATAAGGTGLTSAPAAVVVVHDAVAPAASLLAPPADAVLRGAVAVQADASDTGSGVAALDILAGGQRLDAVLAPTPPTGRVGAAATWPTTGTTDGVHTLTVTAIDRAGNRATLGRSMIVDNTPPETEITAGPAATLSQPTATFAFAGVDNLTPAAGLRFAWRLDGGPWSAPGADTAVTVTDLTPGSHLFEVFARDLAGNDDPTPAARAFTVPSAAVVVTITEPLAGAAVPAGTLLVRGTVDPPDAAVSVNGAPALVHGSSWAAEVRIGVGPGLLTARATVQSSGAEGTSSIPVDGSGAESAIGLRAAPAGGIAPLTVTWQITNRTGRPLVRFELDPEGSGAFGAPTTALDDTQATFSIAGLFVPTVRVTDDQGNVHLARTVLQVETALSATLRFEALWTGFKSRLLAGDASGALGYLSPSLRPRFQRVFADLGADLPVVAGTLGPLALLHAADQLAEAAIVQVEDGTPSLYFVYFRRDNRGRWLIQEM